jgi:hypothetical protein
MMGATGAPMKNAQPWHAWLVTALVGATAVGLVWPTVFPDAGAVENSLPGWNRRATQLGRVADPVERERLCTPLAAYGRSLDRTLAPGARVFLAGILGKENGTRIGVYYFLRNYLFPRTVEISRDGRPVFHESWYEGVPGDDPDGLRADGYDVLVRFAPDGKRLETVPLSERGAPK